MIITGIYTVFGGMRAIMNTATPQAVIILFGSFVITAIGLSKLGGWGELVAMCQREQATPSPSGGRSPIPPSPGWA